MLAAATAYPPPGLSARGSGSGVKRRSRNPSPQGVQRAVRPLAGAWGQRPQRFRGERRYAYAAGNRLSQAGRAQYRHDKAGFRSLKIEDG